MDEKTREALDRILKSIRDARRTRAQDDPFGYRARTWPATEEIKDLEALAHLQAMAEENARLNEQARRDADIEGCLRDENAALKVEIAQWKPLIEATTELILEVAELLEVATLRGDTDLPHPADDQKLWTARMQTAWDGLRAALKKEVEAWRILSETNQECSDEWARRALKAEAELAAAKTKCERCPFGTMLKEYQEDDDAALKAEVERLRQRLTDSMGDHVAVSVEAEELQARAEKAEAEAEQNKALIADLTQDMNEYHDKAETAEAELAEYKSANEKYWQMLQEQGKELARWRPLIEAVGRAGEAIIDWDGRHTTKAAGDILRSALKCREEKP